MPESCRPAAGAAHAEPATRVPPAANCHSADQAQRIDALGPDQFRQAERFGAVPHLLRDALDRVEVDRIQPFHRDLG